MAWRLQDYVVRGEIDNRQRGRVTGRIWLAAVEEPLNLDLTGDCEPDLAGCLLRFENPNPIEMTTKPLSSRQRGKVGEMTAARKVRVFDIPFDQAYAMIKAGGAPPEHMANSLYLEWHSESSGPVLIETSRCLLQVSDPAWRFTAEEISERNRLAADAVNPAFAADGSEEEWDEFRCEEFLRESDARGEKYRHLLEKYIDHPDCDRIVAHEMGWMSVEEALADRTESGEGPMAAEDLESDEIVPPPDPSREGIDWVRDRHGEIAHPIKQRATDMVHALLDEMRDAGNPEEHHLGLGDFVGHSMVLSGKLAGALGSVARGWDTEPGLTIASLKRALEILHQALAAAEALGPDTPFPAERIAYFRGELFGIREGVIAVMAGLRDH